MTTKVRHEIEVRLEIPDATKFYTTRDFLKKIQNIFCAEFNCDQCPFFGCGLNKNCSSSEVQAVFDNSHTSAKFYID